MRDIPEDLTYTRNHEWVRALDHGLVEIGITDHAQAALGDLVFVELPEVGRQVAAGDAFAWVESVKAASDVYSPVSGRIAASNIVLSDKPDLVNHAPYAAGWFIRVQVDGAAPKVELFNAEQYQTWLIDQS